ncbi:hypothetical protein Tco_1131254 [Tanacetum coccineum]
MICKFKGIQQEKEKPAAQSFTPYGNFSMIEDVEVLMKDIYTFLRKFSRISFGVTPKVILIAWERYGKIKDDLMNKQYQQEDIQELISKLLEDVRNISEEFSECPSWNRPLFYFDDDEDEYTEFAGKLTPIPLGMEEDEFDEEEDNCYDDDTSSDDDSFENINYVEASPPDYELVSLEEVEDVILHDKLSNVYLLISKIEALNDNPTLSSFSYFDNSFSDHMEETRSGSTTTHADISLLEYNSFLFEIEPNQGGLSSVVISDNSNDPLLELPEFESFHFDPSFPRPLSEPQDVEICLNFEPDTPVINNFDELNEDECFDPRGGEIVVFQNDEDDDSFTFVIQTFSPFFFNYPMISPFTSLTQE